MASVREQFTKDGKRYYEIRCRRGRNKSEVTTRWYVPSGISEKTVERRLQKAIAEFETSVANGTALTYKERKQAEEEAIAEQKKIQTFKQYVESVYLPALGTSAKNHTMSSFKSNLKNHIYPHIGEMKLPEISNAEIDALLLAEQKNLCIGSMKKIYTILRLIFQKAYKNDLVKVNPMEKADRPKAKQNEEIIDEPESYTAEETLRILECLSHEPFQWQCYVHLLTDTGCRRGEACGLQWQDIDFENNAVSFVRQLAYTPEDGVYVDTLKNRKSRKVYIDPDVMDMFKTLKEYKYGTKKIVSIEEGKADKPKPDERYIFTQIISQSKEKTIYSDDPMHPDSPTRYFKKFGNKYGIDHFHPHKLRHTQASLAITNGADVVSVSRKIGHSNPSTTLKIYSHSSDESQKRASDIFRLALESAKKQDEKKTGSENK